jgi:hypothetical protein
MAMVGVALLLAGLVVLAMSARRSVLRIPPVEQSA